MPRKLPQLPQLKNFRQEMDQVSTFIVDAEKRLRGANCMVPVSIGVLHWQKQGKEMRILVKLGTDAERPLADASFETRTGLLEEIPKLMIAAEEAMDRFVSGQRKAE